MKTTTLLLFIVISTFQMVLMREKDKGREEGDY
jgi:hypothetical protein